MVHRKQNVCITCTYLYTVHYVCLDASPLLNPNDPLALVDYETYDANIFAFSGSERPKLGRVCTVYMDISHDCPVIIVIILVVVQLL